MRLLLDTHTFLWLARGDQRLSDLARGSILAAENEKLLSIASLWEMAIKSSLGKLQLRHSILHLADSARRRSVEILQISPYHLAALESLPLHHRDPFDRLLIAQAKVDKLTLVSRDRALDAYEIDLLWS